MLFALVRVPKSAGMTGRVDSPDREIINAGSEEGGSPGDTKAVDVDGSLQGAAARARSTVQQAHEAQEQQERALVSSLRTLLQSCYETLAAKVLLFRSLPTPPELPHPAHGRPTRWTPGVVQASAAAAHTLQRLDISWNNCGSRGAAALGNALLCSLHLQELNLTQCRVGVVGAVCLADGVRENPTKALRKLTLDGNPLGALGGRAVLAALRELEADREISMVACNLAAIEATPPWPDRPEFDPSMPGGSYHLDMSRPYDRAVANELLRQARRSGGHDEWRNVRVDGRGFTPPSPAPDIGAAIADETRCETSAPGLVCSQRSGV